VADESLESKIRENASGPSEATVDDQTVRQHPLKDQIEADRYLAGRAAARGKGLGFRRTLSVPPSAGGYR
jgi:hypothetical protein